VLALPYTLGAAPQPDIRNVLDDMIDGTPTSGSLSTQANSNWSTAPWMITAGSGTYPDGGGTATFLDPTNTTVGTLPGLTTITLDVPISLSAITFNSMYQYLIAGTQVLSLANTGGTINVVIGPRNIPSFVGAGVVTVNLGSIINAPIGGGGTAGLTKIGTGTLTLGGTNTYTGGTTINGGILAITTGNAALGDATAGNDVRINDAQLLIATAALVTARNFAITGNATINAFNAAGTINGIISGSGNLIKAGNSALTLTGANTYTGTTTLRGASTTTISGGNGSIASSSAYDLAGTLALDNATANNNDRLNDTATITSRGATITMTGNASAATTENAGALNLASGNTTVTVTANAAQPSALNFASINRLNNSTLFVRGSNLGGPAGNGVAQIGSTTSPGTLVGGGGAAGSTNISILPWGVGNIGAAATLGSTHLTYSGGNFRPLAVSEYAAAFGGSPTDNVRITATTAAPADSTVNALLFAPAAAATLSGGPINITSGSFLYSPTATATGTVSAGLNFGSAEGFIHTSNTLNISGVISGTNGLTINPFNNSTVTLTGANTYSGATIINGGQLTFAGTIDAGSAGPLGQSSAPIILNVGSQTNTRIWVNGTTVINRDIIVRGNPSQAFNAGLGSTSTNNITINGNIDLQRKLTIENGSTMPFTINGVVSGIGSLSDAFTSLVVLNGNNTYSGGTEITTGTYELGSDTGFGSGTVYFTAAGGTIRGSGTTPRTIANNVQINSTLNTTTPGSNPTFGGTAPLTFSGAFDLNGGTRGLNVTNTAPTTITGVVQNGGFQKFGTGQLSLNSVTGNTYTGGTIVNAGILNVNNTSGSGTGTGTVSVAAAGTLSGNFSISGATVVNGTLSPGNSAGTANFGSSLSLGSAAVTNMELASPSSFDRVNVANLLTLDGTINIITIEGFVVQAGMTFDLFDWGSINATGFNPSTDINFSMAQTAPGVTWDTSNFTVDGTITAVPEPSTYALLASGLVFGVAAYRRRRARNNS
jgi:autotransporter-associated beta strand protein